MVYVPESAKPATWLRRHVQGLIPFSGSGIDVGAGRVILPEWQWWERLGLECRTWDIVDGDAQDLAGVPDASFDWLFSSHVLEHLPSPRRALCNWLRVVKPGGWLLISVPHRQLYEQKTSLPSRWNSNHVRFYLPFEDDGAPGTVGLFNWLRSLEDVLGFGIRTLVTGDWGHTNTGSGNHPNGEYCIDALLRKRA